MGRMETALPLGDELRFVLLTSAEMDDLRGNPSFHKQGLRFYTSIWLFHVVIVLGTLGVSVVKWWPERTWFTTLGMVLVGVCTAAFLVLTIGRLRPTRRQASIEIERRTWLNVFSEARRA